jgi:hypothetical protein
MGPSEMPEKIRGVLASFSSSSSSGIILVQASVDEILAKSAETGAESAENCAMISQ